MRNPKPGGGLEVVSACTQTECGAEEEAESGEGGSFVGVEGSSPAIRVGDGIPPLTSMGTVEGG